jgi:acetate kinase
MESNSNQILVLNAGSSSLKIGLFNQKDLTQTAEEGISWGKDAGNVQDHQAALHYLMDKVDLTRLAGVGHRVVHGGTTFTAPVLIDREVKAKIKELIRLAPLHNGPALVVIETTEKLLPGVRQVAAFDTAFHSTLAPSAYLYPVPYRWFEQWGIRRFGFHGLSYTYCAERAAQILESSLHELKLVACHLGSGCSLAAIDGGRSVATTMGFTPLEGLMMGSRSGSIDPGILLYLLKQHSLSVEALDRALNYESGLKAISGTGDFREILAGCRRNEERSKLAFEMFVNRISQGIAEMAVALGHLDGLVFAGGIGEHSPELREAVSNRLGLFGIEIDPTKNQSLEIDGLINSTTSKLPVLVIHTREDLIVARQTIKLLASGIS